MAIDFYKLGRQSGATTPKNQQSGFEAFVGGATKPLETMLANSKAATAALTAAMPAGVPIDKVPEELRGQVTEYLTNNKKAYTDATKVIASGINPQSQRYKDAVETINGVNTKFENLSNTLEDIAVKRKQALDDPTFSPATLGVDQLTFENLQNGSLYSSMKLNEDGTFNYMDGENNLKAWSDFAIAKQNFTGQNAYLGAVKEIKDYKLAVDGAKWSSISQSYEDSFNVLFKQLGPKGSADFAFADDGFLKKNYANQDLDSLKKDSANVVQKYKEYVMQKLSDEFDMATPYSQQFGATDRGRMNIKANKKKAWDDFINVTTETKNKKIINTTAKTPKEQIDWFMLNINDQIDIVYNPKIVKDGKETQLQGYYRKRTKDTGPYLQLISRGTMLNWQDISNEIDYNKFSPGA